MRRNKMLGTDNKPPSRVCPLPTPGGDGSEKRRNWLWIHVNCVSQNTTDKNFLNDSFRLHRQKEERRKEKFQAMAWSRLPSFSRHRPPHMQSSFLHARPRT